MKQIAPIAAAALAAMVLATPAMAGTASGTMAVSATVVSTCRSDAADLSFGEVNDRNPRGSAQSLLSLTCTPGTPYAVSIDNGRNGNRTMVDATGSRALAYQIYRDAAASQPWGSGSSGVSGLTPANGRVVLNAYGRIVANRAVAGHYSDVVTVTVDF